MGLYNNTPAKALDREQATKKVLYGTLPLEYKKEEEFGYDSYYKGLQGLSKEDRQKWEDKYMDKIQGLSEKEKDNYFRNTVFISIFKDSKDPEKQEIWNNRKNLSIRERDNAVSKFFIDDYDKNYESLHKREGILRHATKPLTQRRRAAMNSLDKEVNEKYEAYRQNLYSLDPITRRNLINEFDNLASSVYSYYDKYKDTSKLNLSDDAKLHFIAKYQAGATIAGNSYAQKALGEKLGNIVAEKQSVLEKAVNSGAQFIDSAIGMLIRGVGMLGAMTGIGLEEGEGYLENIIDNAVTRYGDRVATTNSYDPEEQEKLEALGISDNAIHGTAEQQESWISWNTPFELFGQYGFTTASTLMTLGGGALVSGTSRLLAGATRAAVIGKGIKATAMGTKMLRGIIKSKDVGNFLVVGGVSMIEGGMNAAQTKRDALGNFESAIDSKYMQKAQNDIENLVRNNPNAAANLLKSQGYDVPNPTITKTAEGSSTFAYSKEDIDNMITLLQNDEDTVVKAFNKYSKDIAKDKEVAEDKANSAMYIDFIGNSLINGYLNATLKACLNAKSIQTTLRKYGFASNPIENSIETTRTGGKFVAKAKKYSKGQAFKNRLKESLGEGFEEYTQDLSSAFALGVEENSFNTYLEKKFGGENTESSMIDDFSAGFAAASKKALSKEAIKDGLYGGLSTSMGGLNVNSHILNGTSKGSRQKGESLLSYINRKSPIGWRSAFGPLISNSEVNAVNGRREEIAKRINEYFADPTNQEAFFNLVSTTEWMKDMETAAKSKDQMKLRDARLGNLFSNIVHLNSLEGTGYYDAVIACLEARASLNKDDLQDENSEASKLVAQYKEDTVNRGQKISDEEAFDAVKSNAEKMLSTIDKVAKETEKIEKLYGEDLDKDVKAGLVFQRISSEDRKERLKTLNKELNEVKGTLAAESSNSSSSNLNKNAKQIIARYGSVDKASGRVRELDREIARLTIFEEDIEDDINDQESEIMLALLQKKANVLIKERDDLISSIKKSKLQVKTTSISTTTDTATAEENTENITESSSSEDVVDEDGSNENVLSALEIMNLDERSRAAMLNPNAYKNYSKEQQKEIDKVKELGVQKYEDFDTKIQDAARLSASYEYSIRQQLDMMSNPESFTREASRIKAEAQKRMYKERYKNLLLYKPEAEEVLNSYENFRYAISEIMYGEDQLAKEAVREMLIDNKSEFFERYRKDESVLEEFSALLKNERLDSYNKLNDNEKSLFIDTILYIDSQGVDFNDVEKAVEELQMMHLDPQTDTHFFDFEKFIDRMQSESVFTSIGEIIQAYKDIMEEYHKYQQDTANNNKDIEVTPISENANVNKPSEKPEPKNQEKKGKDTENTDTEDTDSTLDKEENKENKDNSNENKDSIVQDFEDNSNKEVANSVSVALKIISNQPHVSDESRTKVRHIIEDLSENSYETTEQLINDIIAQANSIEVNSEEGNDEVAALLRQAASKMTYTVASSKSINDKKQQSLLDKKRQQVKTGKNQMPPMNAKGLTSINIDYIRKEYPNSAVAKYYDQYHIEEAIDDYLLENNPDVIFITDEQLTEAVKADMGNTYNAQNSLPIVAVIESKNGPITIGNKKYQPISVMPSTQRESTYMPRLRQAAQSNKGTQIITIDNKPVVTKVTGIKALNRDQDYRGHNNAIEIALNDLTQEEKISIENASEEDKKKTAAYKKAKKNFLKRLAIVTKNGTKLLVLRQSRLYQEQKEGEDNATIATNDINIFVTPINRTVNAEGRSIEEYSGPINLFNSRTRRAASDLERFFKNLDSSLSDILFESDGSISAQSEEVLEIIEKDLERTISNYLSFPVGWHIKMISQGNGDWTINVTDAVTHNTFQVITYSEKHNFAEPSQHFANSMLLGLILNDDNKVRMIDSVNSFMKWQVPYQDIENMESSDIAANNISDIYDDGILETAATSFDYTKQGLEFQSPFGEIQAPVTAETSNANNAKSAKGAAPIVERQTKSGEAKVTDDGVVLEGKPITTTTTVVERVAKIVEKIKADSKKMKLSHDGTFYENTETGEILARVTSIISADSNAGERFNPNSPWALPSSNIGTNVDVFVRDFFDGKIDDMTPEQMAEKYANATAEDFQSFKEQLIALRNNFTANGLTIIPNGIIVRGTLDVLDSQNKIHKVAVAGTLDLLAYDEKGNFYIFDMKTSRSGIRQEKKDRYARQLSLYKKFLEDQYGIKVKTISIIPIKVDYPTPAGVGTGTANYTLNENKENQLLINGNSFTEASPTLGNIIAVKYQEPSIVWDKMTEEEKAEFGEVENAVKATTNNEVAPVEAAPEIPEKLAVDPTLGASCDESYLGDMFEMEDSDFDFTMESQKRSTPIPDKFQWNNLSDQQKTDLQSKGYNETSWSYLEDNEMEHELKCS